MINFICPIGQFDWESSCEPPLYIFSPTFQLSHPMALSQVNTCLRVHSPQLIHNTTVTVTTVVTTATFPSSYHSRWQYLLYLSFFFFFAPTVLCPALTPQLTLWCCSLARLTVSTFQRTNIHTVGLFSIFLSRVRQQQSCDWNQRMHQNDRGQKSWICLFCFQTTASCRFGTTGRTTKPQSLTPKTIIAEVGGEGNEPEAATVKLYFTELDTEDYLRWDKLYHVPSCLVSLLKSRWQVFTPERADKIKLRHNLPTARKSPAHHFCISYYS